MMTSVVKQACKLSHKQFRAMLKKFRRKKKRQKLAEEREQKELLEQRRRENSPNFKAREEEKRRCSDLWEQFEERESIRKQKAWLLREEQDRIEFRKKQEQIELDKIKREEERKRILAEFEQQQYVESKAEEESQKIKSQKEEALQEALSNLPQGDGPWHNPIAPESYNHGQEREQCQFFAKTGCCRFGERCSRGHIHPAVSTTILIRGMYTHFSIGQTARDDFDTDDVLEYEDKERYQDFENFYWDVLPEFKKFGKVSQFKVCSNHEPHLRGNVYVQFSNEEEAVEAYKSFNGRFYAAKQLTCEFTHVIKWRSAICGLYFRKQCPKGINCNFLHVFKNPSDEFWEADRDLPVRENFRSSHSSRSNYSRDKSGRKSPHRNYSSERYHYRRDYSNHHYRTSYHHDRSTDSESGEEDSSRYNSSRSSRSTRSHDSPHRSHHRRKHKRSKSRSQSPISLSDDDTSNVNNHKKNKHKKKKKSKKNRRKKNSGESEDS